MIRRRCGETLFLLEVVTARRNVGLGDDDRFAGNLRLQRDRVAAAGHADRLRVDGSGAILADHAMRALIEPDAAADLAGIEQSRNLSIGLLIEPETDFYTAFVRLEAME